eukprot:gene12902-13028_t
MADVAFPEDTYSLVDCFTISQEPDAVAAWSDPWPVSEDPQEEDCWLYTATAKDTISGMADHFQVNILKFIDNNTRRGVIPVRAGDSEPQLQPATTWAGRSFQTEGVYVWESGSDSSNISTSGSIADFFLWSVYPDQEPAPEYANGDDCVELYTDRQDELWPPVSCSWNDVDCSIERHFVCGGVVESSDPCVRYPCRSMTGDTFLSCSSESVVSGQASLAITHNRTCTCQPGWEYISDEVGCATPYQFRSTEVSLAGALHKIFYTPASWTEAERICCEAGMTLVEIKNSSYALQ